MGYRMAEGVRWDDFDEALAAVRDVGPGGHYLGHPHTQANFERAFFMPRLFDNNSIEQWQADGSQEITERALTHARRLLSEYEEPRLDEGVDEALRDYMARRMREIPAVDALNNEHSDAMGRFAGRTALVTGAAGGIGAALVCLLRAEGALVAVADVDVAGVEAEVCLPGDLSDPAIGMACLQLRGGAGRARHGVQQRGLH